MRKGFLENLGEAIIPEKIRGHIKKYLVKTGSYEVPYALYSGLFFFSAFLSVLLYFLYFFNTIKTANPLYIALTSFIFLSLIDFAIIGLIILCLWLYYEFVIFRRTQMIEEVLPDFLEGVSVNIRSGMGFDKALWNSVEPEFGILEKEIEIVAKKVMGGDDTEQALKEFAEKYNSTLLCESMDMIVVGIKSGGNISDLIDKIVENVKAASFLRKELIASVTSYIIFITIIAILISPTLFALSFNLMEIIQSLGEKISITSSYSVLPISFGYNTINPADFILFSKISIIIITTISSMIIADLREGSIKAGIKYVFLFVPVSYLVYVIMLGISTGLFGVLV